MLEEWLLKKKEIEDSKDTLNGADLCYAKLMEAKLSDANLEEADLTQAVLSEANLSGADMNEAELTDTFLNGANLQGVLNLTCDQIELANFDKDTVFPSYMRIKWSADGNCECLDDN